MRKPSPALIISLLALVFSLSGTAYAVKLIDGKTLKNRSVAGKKLKRDTVGGTQVYEEKLGKVPSAAKADTAASAASSDAATRAISAGRADTAGRADSAGQADNATTLGSLSPGAFVQGGGRTYRVDQTVLAGNTVSISFLPGFAELNASCPSGDTSYNVRNVSPNDVNFVAALGGATSAGTTAPGTQIVALNTNVSSLRNVQLAEVGGQGRLATFVVSVNDLGSTCRYTVQGLLN